MNFETTPTGPNERELAGREAARLYFEQIRAAKQLSGELADKMIDFESTGHDEWKSLNEELDRTITAFEGLGETTPLDEEAQGVLKKLNTQKEYLELTVLPYFERRAAS